MNWIISKLVKLFFNTLYKFKPPEAVHYYKTQEAAKARVITGADGSLQMEIQGEKYPFTGFPRGHVLTGGLSKLKQKVKDMVFNQVFAEIEKMYGDMKHDALPPERMPVSVRHIWETFEKLEEMEIVDDMRGRIKLIKKVLCFFLESDDAYRFRAQMFLDLIEQKKIRLSKADLYYARGKYWRADRFKRIFGRWMDAYEY